MTTTTFTFTTTGGRTYKRTSARTYTHAAIRNGVASFHESLEAAKRAAGRGGSVYPVAPAAPVAARVAEYDLASFVCTVRNAVSGECGKPAVYVLPGGRYAECADHVHPANRPEVAR